jgi:nitrogen fixation NifU-like protein
MLDKELYKQVISDHNRNPYCYGKCEEFSHYAKGYNPTKGDEIEVFLQIIDDVIVKCSFIGSGGAVFTASASIMMGLIENKSVENAKKEFEKFVGIFRDGTIDADLLGKLIVFAGIREFPDRVKCAVLPWHTMMAAIENTKQIVSTELFR